LPIHLSILLDKSIGHTSTDTKKYWQYFIAIPFYSILTTLERWDKEFNRLEAHKNVGSKNNDKTHQTKHVKGISK